MKTDIVMQIQPKIPNVALEINCAPADSTVAARVIAAIQKSCNAPTVSVWRVQASATTVVAGNIVHGYGCQQAVVLIDGHENWVDPWLEHTLLIDALKDLRRKTFVRASTTGVIEDGDMERKIDHEHGLRDDISRAIKIIAHEEAQSRMLSGLFALWKRE